LQYLLKRKEGKDHLSGRILEGVPPAFCSFVGIHIPGAGFGEVLIRIRATPAGSLNSHLSRQCQRRSTEHLRSRDSWSGTP
jgi:hypothetical protein